MDFGEINSEFSLQVDCNGTELITEAKGDIRFIELFRLGENTHGQERLFGCVE